jgi:hypothetical protein
VKQARSVKADGPLVGPRGPAGPCKAPDTGTVVKATAVAGPTEAGWTEEVVARSSLPLGVNRGGPVVGIGWSKQGEARPGETTVVVVDIIPRAIMQAREEKSMGRM